MNVLYQWRNQLLRDIAAEKQKRGKDSQKEGPVSDPVTHQGLNDWLVYVIGSLVTAVVVLWNTHISSRIKKQEDTSDNQWSAIHASELRIVEKFIEHEKEERTRDAEHDAAVAAEFKELRKDVNEGHKAILKEVNHLAREIRRNGNGNGRT